MFVISGYKTVFNNSSYLDYFSWILVVGLIASFHSFLFCTGRLLYAISRDGLFPSPLSRVQRHFKTPYIALITGSLMSYAITIILYYVIDDADDLGSVMINLALLGDVLFIVSQIREDVGRIDDSSQFRKSDNSSQAAIRPKRQFVPSGNSFHFQKATFRPICKKRQFVPKFLIDQLLNNLLKIEITKLNK